MREDCGTVAVSVTGHDQAGRILHGEGWVRDITSRGLLVSAIFPPHNAPVMVEIELEDDQLEQLKAAAVHYSAEATHQLTILDELRPLGYKAKRRSLLAAVSFLDRLIKLEGSARLLRGS